MPRFCLALAALMIALPARAQTPSAAPADVASIDAILAATYAVISGPADEPRDWDRFRSLLHPQARLMPLGRQSDGVWAPSGPWTREEYAAIGADAFATAPMFQGKGFYEVESARRVERYEHLAHVWSTYESRLSPDEAPFARGINSIQLLWDGARWWVLSIVWEEESEASPIPGPYLPEDG